MPKPKCRHERRITGQNDIIATETVRIKFGNRRRIEVTIPGYRRCIAAFTTAGLSKILGRPLTAGQNQQTVPRLGQSFYCQDCGTVFVRLRPARGKQYIV
ncbi:MAG: hypothetical protein WC107_06975 [Patescibacteria group bacterium]